MSKGERSSIKEITVTDRLRDQYEADKDGHYKIVSRYKDDETGNIVKRRKQLVDARVRITAAYAEDAGEPYPVAVTETPDRIRPVVTHLDLHVSRPEGEVNLPDVPVDDFEKVTWIHRAELASLPVHTVGGQTGRNDICTAIRMSSPHDITLTYGRLGWHYRDGRWIYVHGGGAWSADGPVNVRIHGDGLGLFTMAPPPATDDHGIRAFFALWDLFEMGPDKFAAVEIGAVFRAAMGRPVGSITYRAQNQSGKSGRMAFLTQCWAPSVRWRRLPFNAGKQFATPAYIEDVHHRYGDMIVPWDDMAPVGTPRERADYFDMFSRSLFNGSSKGRMGVKDNKIEARKRLRPRAFGILSAEDLDGVESALNRTHILRLSRELFDAAAFEVADKGTGPEDRSALMSAFIIWWAAKMPAHAYVADLEAYFHAHLAEATGAPGRYIESVADKAAGLWCGLEFAKDRGWVHPDRAQQLWERAWAGLCESLVDQVDALEGVSMSDRIRDAIYEGLATKSIHVLGMEGDCPADHGQYGWTFDGKPQGSMVGWTDNKRLYLIPSATAGWVAEYTTSTGAPVNITPRAMGESLEGAGLITGSDENRGGRIVHRYTIPKKIQGRKQNVWSMLLPGDDDEPEQMEQPVQAPPLQVVEQELPEAPKTYKAPARSDSVKSIAARVAEALREADGDQEKAEALLIKRAIPDAMELLESTRVSARYDFTAHPPEPEILRKPSKGKSNAIWEARPNWRNKAVTDGTKVHALDVNAAYLSAMNTHLPIGKLEHSTDGEFDRRRSGVYLVTPPAWEHDDIPSPIGNREEPGKVWLTRPTVQLLFDAHAKGLCDAPVIHESWTSGSSENLLRAFRDILRDARTKALLEGDELTMTYIKAMYSRIIATATKASRFNHRLERTDWVQIIRAQAHGNLWRKALKARDAGLTVYRVTGTDELHVVGDWRQVFTEGRALSQMKAKDSYILGEES